MKSSTVKKSDRLLPHKLSSLVPGEMHPEEFTALCTSIKEHGLQNAIILYESAILDGRERYNALLKLGCDVGNSKQFVTFKGSAGEAAALVLDNNLHRRQLNSMQKALVASRMHLDNKMSQKDAAERVGCGVATVNLACRLLISNNTPLIKRCENGDATRAEIDEILYDRSAATAAETVTPLDDAGGEDNALPKGASPANVIDFSKAQTKAGKRSTTGRRATETPASRAVALFKSLSTKERASFVIMAWAWLQPALKDAGKAGTAAVPGVLLQGRAEAKPLLGKAKTTARATKKAARATKKAEQAAARQRAAA